MLARFAAEHEALYEVLSELRTTADLVASTPEEVGTRTAVARVHRRLVEQILPHEYAEEHRLYPALAKPLGGRAATATMSRAHVEIERLVARVGTHLQQSPGPGLRPAQLPDLLASLYGLHAILQLHFVQEEEQFFSLAVSPDSQGAATRAVPR
jgi:hypothetical protein